MTLPTVHLNGTSRDRLREQWEQAHDALYKALDAIYEAQPNARDYYVQVDGAFEKARVEHQARIDRLRAVHSEAEEILSHLLETP